MNLEELKILWNTQEQAIAAERVDRGEVLTLLEGRGRTALGRINRNILIEMAVVALFGLVWIFMLVSKSEAPSKLEIGGIFLYVIISAVFYTWKFRSLNAARLVGKNLKSALQHTVQMMGRFMKIYFWAGWVLVPILGTATLLFSAFREFQNAGIDPTHVSAGRWAVFAGILVLYNILAVIFVRWYVQKLYGKHHQILKGALAELEEGE